MPPPPPPIRTTRPTAQHLRAKPSHPPPRALAPLSNRNRAKLALIQRKMTTAQAALALAQLQAETRQQEVEVLRALWEETQADPDGSLSAELSGAGSLFQLPLQPLHAAAQTATQTQTASPQLQTATTADPSNTTSKRPSNKSQPKQAPQQQQPSPQDSQQKEEQAALLSEAEWRHLSFNFGVSFVTS